MRTSVDGRKTRSVEILVGAVLGAAFLLGAEARAACVGKTCVTDIDEVALVPNMDGFDATEVCPITSDFMGSQDNMVSNFDVVGADLGISVVDPIAGSHSTVFFGDTVPNNSNGWGAGDMTGYFPSGQFKFLCQGLQATTLSGSLSTVFAPDVMVEPTWAPIGTFVNQPVPAPSGQSIAPGAAVPGSFEVPTGTFAHDLKNGDHNIYLFYTTNNGTASSPDLDSSYVAVWKNPSASVASKKATRQPEHVSDPLRGRQSEERPA